MAAGGNTPTGKQQPSRSNQQSHSRFAWLFKPVSIWSGIILFGALAIPLILKSESYGSRGKTWLVLLALANTALFVWFNIELFRNFDAYVQETARQMHQLQQTR